MTRVGSLRGLRAQRLQGLRGLKHAIYERMAIRPPVSVEYLLVAGGGAGGDDGGTAGAQQGGHGGAGGVRSGVFVPSKGASYSVTIGAGGVGATGTDSGDGGDTSIAGVETATGGGNGGRGGSNGGAGGSGGGAGSWSGDVTPGAGISGQGYDGGDSLSGTYGAGGGGAAGVGGDGGASGATGGAGLVSAITGTPTTYAAGGYHVNPVPTGIPGHGGTGSFAGTPLDGKAGTAILRYRGGQKYTGGTVTTWRGWTVHTFTSTDTFEPI
jgi:hypothetical protein